MYFVFCEYRGDLLFTVDNGGHFVFKEKGKKKLTNLTATIFRLFGVVATYKDAFLTQVFLIKVLLSYKKLSYLNYEKLITKHPKSAFSVNALKPKQDFNLENIKH